MKLFSGTTVPKTLSVLGLISALATVSLATAQPTSSGRPLSIRDTLFSTLPGSDDAVGGRAGYEEEENAAFPATAVAPRQRFDAATAFDALDDGDGERRWKAVGPFVGNVAGPWTYTGLPAVVSGRITALAIARQCRPGYCPLFIGAAGGGVWRTFDGLSSNPIWRPVNRGLPTQAIGALLIDPTDRSGRRLYVGTGEINGSGDSLAGLGLYRSEDFGESWELVPGSFAVAKDRAIGAIAVDPMNEDHILIGTGVARRGNASVNGGRFTPPNAPTIGLYESRNGGRTFSLAFALPSDTVNPATANGSDFFRGGVTKIVAYRAPGMNPRKTPTQFYFSMMSYGLFRTTADGSVEQVFASAAAGTALGSAAARTEFDLAPMGDKLRVYLGDTDATGVADLYRVDQANVPAAQLTGSTGNIGWTKLSDPTPGTPGYGAYSFCNTQCSYDMFVAVPPGQPDTVWIGGQMQYPEIFQTPTLSNGRAVMRSVNAGASFTDMTNDTKPVPYGMHPDQHAIVFSPQNPDIAFIGSDGGLVRTDGAYLNTSQFCGPTPDPANPDPSYRNLGGDDLVNCQLWLSAVPRDIVTLNAGVASLQFQGVSFDPRNPRGKLLGGTQDNGSWVFDGTSWTETVGGDGGNSGINRLGHMVHTFTGATGDINFRGGDPLAWNYFQVPSYQSPTNEAASFYVPLISDLRTDGTWFIGMQHVWRTTDNLGGQAYMELHCNQFFGDFAAPCGNWQALGGPGGIGKPGDLVSTLYGADKLGSYVVALAQGEAAAKGAAASSPLWVATRRGRLFVSTNANAADPATVTFTRIDTSAQPQRFISGIAVDPKRPTHAFVTFSGYAAYTPTTPGHVFDVEFNAATGTATWTDITANLGDLPITAIAYDPVEGRLYAGTDFGVVSLARGDDEWRRVDRGLPRVQAYLLKIDSPSRTLYVATHGRGIYRLDL